jgi:hypothetical protein
MNNPNKTPQQLAEEKNAEEAKSETEVVDAEKPPVIEPKKD